MNRKQKRAYFKPISTEVVKKAKKVLSRYMQMFPERGTLAYVEVYETLYRRGVSKKLRALQKDKTRTIALKEGKKIG